MNDCDKGYEQWNIESTWNYLITNLKKNINQNTRHLSNYILISPNKRRIPLDLTTFVYSEIKKLVLIIFFLN